MKPGLLLLLLLADALWPCSVEIYSIEVMAARSPNIVVGVIESVEGEVVRGEEGDSPIRALTAARFRIEEPLKRVWGAPRLPAFAARRLGSGAAAC